MTNDREPTLNGVDPEDRINISDTVAMFVELITNGEKMPPLREMADSFLDREDGEGGELSYDDHVSALSELFVATMIMLAEYKAGAHADEGIELHMLMNGEDGQEHVQISVSGYRDPRYAVAALAKLEPDGYLQQMWNVAVRGKVDPQGPQVIFHQHTIKEKEGSA